MTTTWHRCERRTRWYRAAPPADRPASSATWAASPPPAAPRLAGLVTAQFLAGAPGVTWHPLNGRAAPKRPTDGADRGAGLWGQQYARWSLSVTASAGSCQIRSTTNYTVYIIILHAALPSWGGSWQIEACRRRLSGHGSQQSEEEYCLSMKKHNLHERKSGCAGSRRGLLVRLYRTEWRRCSLVQTGRNQPPEAASGSRCGHSLPIQRTE